jgi:NADH-quinone oxidoreductase subunit B
VAVNEGEDVSGTGGGGAAVALGIPRVGAPPVRGFGTGFDLAPKPMKVVLNWGRKYSLWVFNFGLACCAIEFIAASMARHDFIRLGVIPFAPGPRQADLMVVSGTVSDKMAPAVKRLYEQMPEPKYVISFGACANCGGPYWDSYSVTKGIDQVIPVDVYVPGCPPRPEALLQGIVKLQEKIAAEGTGVAPGRAKALEASKAVAPEAAAPKAVASKTVPGKVVKSFWQRPKAVGAGAGQSNTAQPSTVRPSTAMPETVPLPIAPQGITAAPPVEAEPVEAAPVEQAVVEAPTPETPAVESPAPSPVVPEAPAAPDAPTAEAPAPPPPPPPAGSASAPDAPTVEVPVLGVPMPEAPPTQLLPKVKIPRRHYFRELRRARDHGLSLFDKAARDQEWEYDDES